MPRAIRSAFEEILRNGALSGAAVLVMSLAFLTTSAFALFAFGTEKVIDYYESRPLVIAFFKTQAQEADILALRDELLKREDIASVTYTSKEQALELFKKEYFSENPDVLESVPADVLPASLDVRTKSLDDLSAINQLLVKNPLVESTRFLEDVIENFRTLARTARFALLSLAAIFSLITVFITLTTIGLTIHTLEDEIEITRLLGASSWYIRAPFIFQGAFYGVMASLLSAIVVALVIPFAYEEVTSLPPLKGVPLDIPTLALQAKLLLAQVGGGALLGSLGSLIAVNRYL